MIDPNFLFTLERGIAALGISAIDQIDIVPTEDGTGVIVIAYADDGSDHIFSTESIPENFVEDEYRAALSGASQPTATVQ